MDNFKRLLELSGIKATSRQARQLVESQQIKEDMDLFEALKLQHDRENNVLVVVSDQTDPKAASGETYKNRAIFKANGFKWDGSNWTISTNDYEKAASIVNQANKVENLIGKLEDVEEYLNSAQGSSKKSELMGKIEIYVNKLATETDEKAVSAEIQRYLNFFASFHQYSFHNKMLVYIQRPNATKVASFDSWKKIHRVVKKGAKGIMVMVPIFHAGQNPLKNKDAENTNPISFKVGYVYDIADTEATSEEGNIPETPQWWGSNEPNETADAIFTLVTKAAAADGIKITYEDAKGGEHGYSSGGHINISSSVQGAEKASVMIHEYAHELMHWKEKSKFYAGDEVKGSKEMKELQAESVAYIVLTHYDIPAEHNTTYLALWNAKGDLIKKNMQLISNVAHHIITGIDKQAGKENPDTDIEMESVIVETFINEILKKGHLDVGTIGLSDDEIKNAEEVSTVMRLPLYKFDKNGEITFFLIHDNRVIAWTKGFVYPYTKGGDLAFLAKRSKVEHDHRGKGLMTGIYDMLNKHLKLAIISDNEQSLDAQQLWKSIYTKNKGIIKKYNGTTGEIADLEYFGDVYGDLDWHFLLEMSENMKLMNGYLKEGKQKPFMDMVVYPYDAYHGRP